MLVAVPLGDRLGAATATAPPTTAIRRLSTLGLAMPSFWFGLLLILIFSLQLELLPTSGYGTGFAGHLESLTLPAITVGLYLAPLLLRTLRSRSSRRSAEYVKAARARGLSETPRDRQARAAQLAGRDGHGPRAQHRLPAQRQRRDRERLLHPGPRLLLVSSIVMRDFPTIQALTLLFGALVIARQPPHRPLYALVDPQGPALSAWQPRPRPRRVRTRRPACCSTSSGARRPSDAGRAISLWIGVAIVGLDRPRASAAPLIAAQPARTSRTSSTAPAALVAHPFGTDTLGRDIFTRIVYAARIDLPSASSRPSSRSCSASLLGARRRLPGRLARHRRHARRRRRRRVPVHRPGDRGDRDRRARG